MRPAAHNPSSAALRQRLAQWLFRTGGAAVDDVVLVQRRVFILPTRQGVLFAGTLVLMLTASVNYNLGLGYVLTFLLGAMGLNAMLHTYRNLANLKVAAAQTPPVFAGDQARFSVTLCNVGRPARHAIALTRDGAGTTWVDVPGNETVGATLALRAERRGMLRPGRLTLYTCYPLGLYRAWSYLELDLHCVVYPRPAPPGTALPARTSARATGETGGAGDEDFGGLRPYQPGDSLRHVAWKASARGAGLLTKVFIGAAAAECWLDWRALPAGLPVEERLSLLARWVIDVHAAGIGYGLRLPTLTLPIASGEAHRAQCLEALALFRPDDPDAARTPA